MLQLAHIPQKKLSYHYNPAFMSAHKTVDTVAQVTLAQDLIRVARNNRHLYERGLKTSRYHFHVINSHGIAVTVVLTRLNSLMVRGRYCKNFQAVYKAIENQKV